MPFHQSYLELRAAEDSDETVYVSNRGIVPKEDGSHKV